MVRQHDRDIDDEVQIFDDLADHADEIFCVGVVVERSERIHKLPGFSVLTRRLQLLQLDCQSFDALLGDGSLLSVHVYTNQLEEGEPEPAKSHGGYIIEALQQTRAQFIERHLGPPLNHVLANRVGGKLSLHLGDQLDDAVDGSCLPSEVLPELLHVLEGVVVKVLGDSSIHSMQINDACQHTVSSYTRTHTHTHKSLHDVLESSMRHILV